VKEQDGVALTDLGEVHAQTRQVNEAVFDAVDMRQVRAGGRGSLC
jgi:hypothetical protein